MWEMLNVYVKNVPSVYEKATNCKEKIDIKNICWKEC